MIFSSTYVIPGENMDSNNSRQTSDTPLFITVVLCQHSGYGRDRWTILLWIMNVVFRSHIHRLVMSPFAAVVWVEPDPPRDLYLMMTSWHGHFFLQYTTVTWGLCLKMASNAQFWCMFCRQPEIRRFSVSPLGSLEHLWKKPSTIRWVEKQWRSCVVILRIESNLG